MWASTKPRGSAPATPVAPPLWPRSIHVLSASLSPAAGAETPPQLPDPPDMMRENDNRAASLSSVPRPRCPSAATTTTTSTGPSIASSHVASAPPRRRPADLPIDSRRHLPRLQTQRGPQMPRMATSHNRTMRITNLLCPTQTNATTIARAPHVAASNHQWPSSRTTMSMTSHALLPIIMPSWRCV